MPKSRLTENVMWLWHTHTETHDIIDSRENNICQSLLSRNGATSSSATVCVCVSLRECLCVLLHAWVCASDPVVSVWLRVSSGGFNGSAHTLSEGLADRCLTQFRVTTGERKRVIVFRSRLQIVRHSHCWENTIKEVSHNRKHTGYKHAYTYKHERA